MGTESYTKANQKERILLLHYSHIGIFIQLFIFDKFLRRY